MLKILNLLCLISVLHGNTFAQSLRIDKNALHNWLSVSSAVSITNDGRYYQYTVSNTAKDSSDLVISSIDGSWRISVVNGKYLFFSEDSEYGVFTQNGILKFLRLGFDSVYSIASKSYKYPYGEPGKWIAYIEHSSNLILRDLTTNARMEFSNVTDYTFSDSGDTFVFTTDDGRQTALECVMLGNMISKRIWSCQKSTVNHTLLLKNFAFSDDGKSLSFQLEREVNGRSKFSVWYFTFGMDSAVLKVDDKMIASHGSMVVIDYNMIISDDNKWIFFYMQDQSNKGRKNLVSNVNIWHYDDNLIQTEQLAKLDEPLTYLTAVNVGDGRILRIEEDGDAADLTTLSGSRVIVERGAATKEPWVSAFKEKFHYLYSLTEGRAVMLPPPIAKSRASFAISPTGKYLLYFDTNKKRWLCFNIDANELIDITRRVDARFDREGEYHKNYYYPVPVGIARWLEGDSAVLIYDNYDIWRLDPMGIKLPINLTNGFGKKNGIKFCVTNVAMDEFRNKAGDNMLLAAFNEKSKFNGFYFTSVESKQSNPQQLCMGPYTYYHGKQHLPLNAGEFDPGMIPVRARDTNVYIVRRMSAHESPNLYYTSNFIDFTQVTFVDPQKKINWLKSELVEWRLPDGNVSQGVLYKPQDFNPTKKYPIIFNFYEQLSYRLYEYPQPAFTKDNINIPWFVNRGYLVFIPDLHFSIGSLSNRTNGENAFNGIVSAAKHMITFPWVDDRRMGIQGHSFGGGVTNYMISHSNIFSAAVEAAGVSNAISSYLRLAGSPLKPKGNILWLAQFDQGRMGATLWERPDLYIRNSSIFKANKIRTPLLIMHNRQDIAVPWQQGVEMYLSLRRLQKKAWMLDYDNGFHSVSGADAEDYTIRLQQFFDHYLKDAPPPTWMTKGIPARLKGIETGYAFDPSASCGKDCNVCKAWNEKWNTDSRAVKEELKKWEKF